MSKSGGNDILLLGALAVGAVFFMGRSRNLGASNTELLNSVLGRGPAYSRNVPGQANNVAMGAAGGAMLGSIMKTGSPDVVASGGYTGGGIPLFSDIGAYDNATQGVQSAISGDIAAGAGIPVNYNWSQWMGQVGGAQSQFYLPDQTDPNQNPYAGFDNPNNYG